MQTTNDTAPDDHGETQTVCPLVSALMDAIDGTGATQRDAAKAYTMAMHHAPRVNWRAVNEAIVARWSMTALTRIKTAAWDGRWSGSPLFDEVTA